MNKAQKSKKILIKSWWKSGQKRVIFCKKILSKNGKIFIKIFSCFLKNPYFMRFKYDTRLLFLITHGLLLSNQLHFCNGCVFCKHGCVFYDRLSSFFEDGCQKYNWQKILIILAKPYFLRVCYPLKFSLNFLIFRMVAFLITHGCFFDN